VERRKTKDTARRVPSKIAHRSFFDGFSPIVAEAELVELGQAAELRCDGSRQIVVAEVKGGDAGELGERQRDRPSEGVLPQGKGPLERQGPERRRKRAVELKRTREREKKRVVCVRERERETTTTTTTFISAREEVVVIINV